ncbi:two component system histidine kinase/response regulator hybrid protein [Eubacterium limosum]|nr:two component system histidine kinase/response regulator hybrid protein [Eubacterium limosum]
MRIVYGQKQRVGQGGERAIMKKKLNMPHVAKHSTINILLVILIMVLIGFALLLGRSYKALNLSIEQERVQSVEQIGFLLSDKVNQLKNVYIDDTVRLVNIIESFNIQNKDELRHVLKADEEVLLATEGGQLEALDGSNWIIRDDAMKENILSGEGVQSSFGSEPVKGDYWLFSCPIAPRVIDGQTVIGVIKAVSAKEYADVAAKCLYNGLGAAYVVDANGVIVMRPETTGGVEAFKGYNLLDKLRNENVPEPEIEALQTSLRDQQQYQLVLTMDGVTWLVQSIPGDTHRGIVITVPVSITAKGTFSSMRQVIILVVLFVLALGGIVLVGVLYALHKNHLAEVSALKIQAKNDFLDKMSHDIRTPLNAIVGMHELALRALDDRDAVADYLNKAKGSSEYLISVVNDILDMSKIESGKMTISHTPFSMETLLNHIYQMESMEASRKNLKLILEMPTDHKTDYMGDPVRIRQCLMNLVSNAIKFTKEGGYVRLACQTQVLDEQRTRVVLTVQDNGIGMSEDFRERLFSPFEQEASSMTSTYTGSGLGLAIVKSLVELMGGSIEVESQMDVGSTFIIELPLETIERTTLEVDELTEEEIGAQMKGKRILFVEDNALNREVGVSLLEQLGLRVDSAENGKEAAEAFERTPAGYYALIFMDIQMPIMNGYEAARHIRSSAHPDGATVPILALSANAFDEDARKSREAGMQGHLAKPIDMTELMRALKKYIQ